MPKPCLLLTLFAFFLFSISCTKENATSNKLPVANAGSSLTITLPVDSVTLTGTGTDADGKIVTYLWEQVSGPYASIIVNPGAPSTAIHRLKQGSYIFQLSVFDSLGGLGVDTMVVTVNAPVTKTLTLQPNNNPNECFVSLLNGVNITALTGGSLEAFAWTKNGDPWTLRGMVKFDLSAIPSTATIKAAHLYLYSDPAPTTGDLVDANAGSSNSFTIQQVSADWSPSSLSWSNQPAGLTANQVVIPTTSQSTLDLNVDVTAQVASMVNNSANYGFILKLENEVTLNSRIFVASHNSTYPDKHPKLVVDYQ